MNGAWIWDLRYSMHVAVSEFGGFRHDGSTHAPVICCTRMMSGIRSAHSNRLQVPKFLLFVALDVVEFNVSFRIFIPCANSTPPSTPTPSPSYPLPAVLFALSIAII
jgi:hypothetical protein